MTSNPDVQICSNCGQTTADFHLDQFCPFGAEDDRRWTLARPPSPGAAHVWVEAVVTDCPFTRRDKRGTFRVQWRQEANRLCNDDAHHYGQSFHVTLPTGG